MVADKREVVWRRHASHYRTLLADFETPRGGGSVEAFEAERAQIELAHERVLTVEGLDEDGSLAHDYYTTLAEWHLTVGPRAVLDVGLGAALRYSHRIGAPVHGALLLDAAAAAHETRRYRRARAFGRSGMRVYERWTDPGPERLHTVETARGHRILGAAEHALGDDETAEEHYRTGLALAEDAGNEEEIGLVLGNLAVLLQDQGRHAEAYSHYLQATSIAERRNDLAHLARWTGNSANALSQLGRLDEATELAQRGLRLAEALKDRKLQVDRWQTLSELAALNGDPRGAVRHQQKAVDLARAWLDDEARANHIGILAVRQADAGDTEAAIASSEEAAQLYDSTGDPDRASAARLAAQYLRDQLHHAEVQDTVLAAVDEAHLTARAGQIGAAVTRLRTLADQSIAAEDDELAAYCLGYLGHWQFMSGDLVAALESYDAAIAHDEPDSALLLIHRGNRASVLRKIGDTETAARDFWATIELSRQIHHDRAVEGIAHYNLAQMADDAGRKSEAREWYGEALAAFTELGAVEALSAASAIQRLDELGDP